MSKRIYLDWNASSPLSKNVFDAMKSTILNFANPSSPHLEGRAARIAIEKARDKIAEILGLNSRFSIVFTSGATESAAMVLHQKKLNCAPIEHDCVKVWSLENLFVNKNGTVNIDDPSNSTLQAANSETGIIQHVPKGIYFTDAVQAFGKTFINFSEYEFQFSSISSHKIGGPKGIGALYVRRKKPRVRITPIMFGGGHERGFRSGTLNVPGIVGFGKAIELAMEEISSEAERQIGLRQHLYKRLTDELDYVFLNGHPTERLPNNLNLSFGYVEGESLMMGISEIAVSSGSACTSASLEPSYVLRSMGVGDDLAHSSVRFGFGRYTTMEEVNYAADKVIGAVKRLREMSPLYEMVQEGVDLSKVTWTSH